MLFSFWPRRFRFSMNSSNTFRCRWCRTRRSQTPRSAKSALTKFNKAGTPIKFTDDMLLSKSFNMTDPTLATAATPRARATCVLTTSRLSTPQATKKEYSIRTECLKIVNSCSPEHVQQVFDCFAPDGIYFMKELNQLMIMEDTENGHHNDYLWFQNAWDAKLVRVMTTPLGSEAMGAVVSQPRPTQ